MIEYPKTDDLSGTGTDTENDEVIEEHLDFLFSARIHLGFGTSNYAEYCGMILC
jgi:hypothetical protein